MQPIIDAHLDLAFNAVGNGADLRLPIAQLRQTPFGRTMTQKRETPTVSLPAMRDGGVKVAFGTIFVPSRGSVFNVTGPRYADADDAHNMGQAQLRYYHDLVSAGEIALLRDRAELDRALAADASPTPGIVISIEGADPIRRVSELSAWIEQGVRVIGPAWGRTRFGGGTGAPGPLTELGRELIDEMSRLRVGLDLAHQSDEGFCEAIRRFRGAVCVSHGNCRALVPGDRQLTDDMIRAVVERDGVIGVVLYNRYLRAGYTHDEGKVVPMSQAVAHIERICDIAGDAAHVGIGSDLDGGLGVEWTPVGLDSIADLPRVGDALRSAGWSETDVSAVLYGNWARWLREQLLA